MSDAFAAVTDAIIAALESGVSPWHRPWKSGSPRNATTGHRYRGLNVITLGFAGYSDPRWLTFRQAQALGGNVKKGEKGHKAYFWKLLDRTRTTDQQDGDASKKVPLLKVYTVFNVEQCENLGLAPWTGVEHNPIEAAERILATMPNRPAIKHGGDRACYIPSLDRVQLPTPEAFESPEHYYGTAFHELGHSTGHHSRLRRFDEGSWIPHFGSESYSKEELVAEFTAAFLSAEAGIGERTLPNSAAYVQGWLKALKNDRRLIIQAASQAQKAADFILDRKAQESTTDEDHEQPAGEGLAA